MGYSVKGTAITLVRGDTLKCQITIKDKSTGETYIPKSGDTVRFAMKASYNDEEPLLKKTIPNETLVLKLEPSDTKGFPFGKYVYDVEITKENGERDTFIQGTLKLSEEVD